jgi:hypothetical protein
VLGLVSVTLWGLNWFLLQTFVPDPAGRGQFGDMFGSVNALFTALAFAGLAYTILLQREELAQQREAIAESMREQQLFQEEQRRKQEAAFKDIEVSRQGFLERTEELRIQREAKAGQAFSDNVLRAIRYELEGLGDVYDQGIGGQVARLVEGSIFETRLALTQDWFTVFNANAVHLGKFEGDLSRRIVTVYALLKSLIEQFRINNQLLELRAEIDFQLLQREGEQHLKSRKEVVHQWLVHQAVRIRQGERDLKATTSELFRMLDARGVK